MPLTAAHRALLNGKAIPDSVLDSAGVYSVTTLAELPEAFTWAGERAVPGIVFPWRTPGGASFPQLRPDTPIEVDGEKRPRKYLWPPGQSSALAVAREDSSGPVIFVEGTKQSLAAAAYVDSGSVYGIAGCRSWSTDGVPIEDLGVAEDREIFLIFDADLADNPEVWDAADRFTRALRAEGASAIRYVMLPAGQKAGLDDVLGGRQPDKRAGYLARLLEQAVKKLPARPRKKQAAPVRMPGTPERPLIVVNEDRLNVIDGVTAALRRKWSGTELFSFGGVLAWRDGPTMEPVTKDRFNDLTAKAALTVAADPKGNVAAAWPDSQTQGAALSRASDFEPLEQITRTPFMRPDGTVCQTSGYDVPTRTYLSLTAELESLAVPEEPTGEELAFAVKLLMDEWLGDFMAVMPSDADRANTLALVLTPMIRGLVPLAPLAVINGLQMGVGKNLLADVLSIFASGEVSQPLPYSREDDENRKVITAAFRSGRSLFVFDEAHVIEGASLARAVTAITYTDRVLGVSTNAEFPNNITWMSLGNNVAVNGDMARRVYIIRLAPSGENPQDRSADDFRHPDIKSWTRAHRAELVCAGLTLIRGWFAAGQVQNVAGRRMGSFEQWGGMVGGILDMAGVPDFLGNLQEWRSESDYERAYWLDHLRWLVAAFGTAEFTTAEVVRAMKSARPGSVEHPPRLEDHDATGYPRALGLAYGRQRGKTIEGLCLIRAVQSGGHGNRWRVTDCGYTTPDQVISLPVTPDKTDTARQSVVTGSGVGTESAIHGSGLHERDFEDQQGETGGQSQNLSTASRTVVAQGPTCCFEGDWLIGGIGGIETPLRVSEKTIYNIEIISHTCFRVGAGGVSIHPNPPINPTLPNTQVDPGVVASGDRVDRFCDDAEQKPQNANPQVDPCTATEGKSMATAHPPVQFPGLADLSANALVDPCIYTESETDPGSQLPIVTLIPLAARPPVPLCPDCDCAEELVPPASFWYACRHCTPGTFHREPSMRILAV